MSPAGLFNKPKPATPLLRTACLLSGLGCSSLLGTKDFGTLLLLRPACREEREERRQPGLGLQTWRIKIPRPLLAQGTCSVDSGGTGLMTLPQRDKTLEALRGRESELGRHRLAVSKRLLEESPCGAHNTRSGAEEDH